MQSTPCAVYVSSLLLSVIVYCLGREPCTIDKPLSVMIMQHLEQLSDMVLHASSSLLCLVDDFASMAR